MPTLAELSTVCASWETIWSSTVSVGFAIQDAQRLSASSPINAQTVRANNHSSSQRPSGDRLNNPAAWEGLDSDFPLNLLISYSYVIADGDLMGVFEELHHCQWWLCLA